MAREPADPQAAQELILFVDNDGDLYRSQTQSIIKNLAAKKASGKYDRRLAVKMFMYLAESGAKKYARQFSSSEGDWHQIFSVATRELAATAWRDEFEEHYKNGEYDDLVPKKYQKPAPGSRGASDYADGARFAQVVASNSPPSAIEYMASAGEVFPRLGSHIPEIVHLIVPKNGKKAEFKRGFVNRMTAIYDAMRGD